MRTTLPARPKHVNKRSPSKRPPSAARSTWTFRPMPPDQAAIKVSVSRPVTEAQRFAVQSAILTPDATPPPLPDALHALQLLTSEIDAITEVAMQADEIPVDVVRAIHKMARELGFAIAELQDRCGVRQ